MRMIAKGAAAVALVIWLCAPAGLAQQARTTLPDVNVTAPVPAPPPVFSPMAGKTRVEEDKWPSIPCDQTRIAVAGGASCQDGPRIENLMSMKSTGAQPAVGSDCNIAHQLVNIGIGRLLVEADIMVFDPYKVTASNSFNKYCMIWSGFRHMPDDFKDMNQVTRRGVAWSNFMPGGTDPGAQSTIQFADGQRACLAVERLGPNWRGGYVWVAHATICEAAAPPISATDIDTVFNSLQTKIYDPSGNLRPPG